MPPVARRMAKREREESEPGLEAALPALAAAVAGQAANENSSMAAVMAAESQARQSLVAAIKAKPVNAVVDVAALQTFKTQHVAMMQSMQKGSATSILNK